ncbi:MAG: SMP-30/gluconolactonase/LRE family protein, partial [Pirellulaceae bacterium]
GCKQMPEQVQKGITMRIAFGLGLLLTSVVSLSARCLAQNEPAKSYPSAGSIEVVDPALHELIDPNAKIEVLASGFIWSEGPVWINDGNYLLFSDIPNNRIVKWSEEGGATTYLKPAGYTGKAERGGETGCNGLLLDAEGRLVLCQHGDRRVARMDAPLSGPAPKFITLADKYHGKRLNSPNDAAFHKNGDLYFTDPPYGLEKNIHDPAKEIPFQGVYRVARDGTVTLLTKELERPNGICFSPDHKTLYVANSHGPRPVWLSFPVKADGTLGKSKVFFDAGPLRQPGRKGGNDGMKVDIHGNLFATGPGGVLIFTPEGKHLGTILTGQATANCGFGDDGRTLYMTADDYLMRVRLKTRGW